MPKISDTRKALGGVVRTKVGKAAGDNKRLSKTEQRALNPFLRNAADALRREQPGVRPSVDNVVDRAMAEAMEAWKKFNRPGRGQETLSREELKSLAERMPDLGQLTREAVQAVEAAKPKPPEAALPNVSLESDHPGMTLARQGDLVTLRATAAVPEGATATLIVDSQRFKVTRKAGGFDVSGIQPNLAEGYGAGQPEFRRSAAGIETSLRITRDPPGALGSAAALARAREGLAEYVRSERMQKADWGEYFPTSWDEAVRDGILQKISAFAAQPGAILREPDKYTFTGAGPYDLYTEVEVRKSDGKILRAYVEID